MDNSYTINVTNITNGIDKLSFNKVLSFNVLFRDDFESYSNNEELFKKWSRLEGAWESIPTTEEYAGLDETNGNKRLVLKKEALVGQHGNDAVLINTDVEANAGTYDSYVLSYDVENARNGQLIAMVNNRAKYIVNCGSVIFGQDANTKNPQTRVFVTGDQLWNNGSGTVLSELTNEKKTVTEISNRTGGDKDELRIYYNGEFKWQIPEDKSFKYSDIAGTFGFGNGYRYNTDSANYVYIDNVKAYKPVWTDADEGDIIISDLSVSCSESEINGTVFIENTKYADLTNSVLIVCAYDEHKRLVGIYELDNPLIEARKTSSFPYNIKSNDSAFSVKVFIWSKKKFMKPISDSLEKDI